LKRLFVLVPLLLTAAACHQGGASGPAPSGTPSAPNATPAPDMALYFADAPGEATGIADNLTMRAQVALDHLGFSPGVIDGKEGQSYTLALKGFQTARDLPPTGKLDDKTRAALLGDQPGSATRMVVIPAGFAKGPFYPDMPDSEEAKAKLPALGYGSLQEALAERFHTTPDALASLNPPGTRLGAGQTIRVPDIANVDPKALPAKDPRGWNETLQKLGVSPEQPQADHLVVDKSEGWLRAYDKDGRIIAQFPVTTGSSHDPLPIGDWTVKGEARNPDYQYNPDLFWDASKNDKDVRLPPGPNGPVGVVWIDLSKEHYGIHGTPEPQNIGRTESHGCVRLTNWDAAKLAEMVKAGTKVKFQP